MSLACPQYAQVDLSGLPVFMVALVAESMELVVLDVDLLEALA